MKLRAAVVAALLCVMPASARAQELQLTRAREPLRLELTPADSIALARTPLPGRLGDLANPIEKVRLSQGAKTAIVVTAIVVGALIVIGLVVVAQPPKKLP